MALDHRALEDFKKTIANPVIVEPQVHTATMESQISKVQLKQKPNIGDFATYNEQL